MKKSSLVIALATALPGLAFAAPPVGFGTDGSADGVWSLDAITKQIDHECPVDFTCSSAPITDNNFIQVQMTDAAGNMYFRTIIMDETGTSPDSEMFVSESFVTTGSTNGGISANQVIDSRMTNGGVLTSTTVLNTGSFNDGVEDQVSLNQGVWDVATNPEFSAGFTFVKNSDGSETTTTLSQQIAVAGEFADKFTFSQTKDGNNGAVLSGSLDIVSGIVLNDAPSGALTDQTFVYSQRSGAAVTGAGNGDFGGGNTVTWVADDTVERVLIGQSVDNAGDFGYERVGNLTTSTALTEFSLASVGPFATINPVDPFGAPGDVLAIGVVPAP